MDSDMREGPGVQRRSKFRSWECGVDNHRMCRGASGALDALWCGCPCHYSTSAPDRHPSALLASPEPSGDSPIVIAARAGE